MKQLSKLQQGMLALLFWILVWQVAALAVKQELLIPSPWTVAKELSSLVQTGYFWKAAVISLLRVFGGFAIGMLLGTILAIMTCVSKLMDVLISPMIRVIRATPVASFIILALLWIGYSMLPVFIATLMVTPVMWANCRSGIMSTNRELLEMGKAYRFGKWKTIRFIYLPSCLPYFYSGLITSLGMAWKSGIAAEVLSLPKVAVGTQLYYSKIYLESPSLFAWSIVIIILSFLLEKLFVFFIGKLQKRRGGRLG